MLGVSAKLVAHRSIINSVVAVLQRSAEVMENRVSGRLLTGLKALISSACIRFVVLGRDFDQLIDQQTPRSSL
jgi:transcriptional regulator NrdR family protein